MKDAWAELTKAFSSQSRARVINTRMALASSVKGSLTITEYFSKMLVDDITCTGKKLDYDEIAGYILAGLDAKYNPNMGGLATRSKTVSLGDLYS